VPLGVLALRHGLAVQFQDAQIERGGLGVLLVVEELDRFLAQIVPLFGQALALLNGQRLLVLLLSAGRRGEQGQRPHQARNRTACSYVPHGGFLSDTRAVSSIEPRLCGTG
jgi:hypothetical protein